MWKTPKTDWVSEDYFNVEDYNRIKGNLEYLHEKAETLYQVFQIAEMGDEKDYADNFYADEFNSFEQNLETINQNIFTQDFGNQQVFYDNGPFIAPEELTRVESAILSMCNLLEGQAAALSRLSFRLGNMKGVVI